MKVEGRRGRKFGFRRSHILRRATGARLLFLISRAHRQVGRGYSSRSEGQHGRGTELWSARSRRVHREGFERGESRPWRRVRTVAPEACREAHIDLSSGEWSLW